MDNLSQKEKQKQLLEEKKRLIAMIKDKQMEIDILKKLRYSDNFSGNLVKPSRFLKP